MIEATLHPAEHVFDPFLNLSAEDQAERWLVNRLASLGFEIERAGPLGGGPMLVGRWERATVPGGAVRFRQWPAPRLAQVGAPPTGIKTAVEQMGIKTAVEQMGAICHANTL